MTPAGNVSPRLRSGSLGFRREKAEALITANERGVLSLQSLRLRLFLVHFKCLHISLVEISAIIYSAFRDAFTQAMNGNVVNTAQSQCSY